MLDLTATRKVLFKITGHPAIDTQIWFFIESTEMVS